VFVFDSKLAKTSLLENEKGGETLTDGV